MKNLLIISYHALPLDVVASYRTKGYCDYLSEYGIFPTLVTHRWEKDISKEWLDHNTNDQVLYEDHKTHKVIRLPRPHENLESKSSFNTLKCWMKGDFDLHLLNSYKVFKNFLFQHLQNNKYDVILAIYSPHSHLKLAYELYKKFKIPYVLDFRDLWDNQVVTKSYNPNYKKKIQDYLIKLYWKKWISNCRFFVTTGSLWKKYLENLTDQKGFVIPNGHEFKVIASMRAQTEFKLIYFGKIYPNQNLKVIMEGISKFIDRVEPGNFKLILIGLKVSSDFDCLHFITRQIHSKYLKLIDYLPKQELIEFCKSEATMFFLPSFYEDNGQFMVKLYDFMALGRPIIIAPQVNSDMETVTSKTNSGVAVDTAESVAYYLEMQYRYFLRHGQPKNDGYPAKILAYHRENHVKSFADLIINKE